MKSVEAMVLWTPDREPFLQARSRGQIAVVTIPEPSSTQEYMCSTGASDEGWSQKNDMQRVNDLEKLRDMIVKDDNIPYATVHAAMQVVDEYKARNP